MLLMQEAGLLVLRTVHHTHSMHTCLQYDAGLLVQKNWNGLDGRGLNLTPVHTDTLEDTPGAERVEPGLRFVFSFDFVLCTTKRFKMH